MSRTGILATDEPISIGVEPMLRRAGLVTKSRTIGILATPSTLASRSYADMKRRWIAGLTVIEPDCCGWDSQIDSNAYRHIDLEATIGEMRRWEADIIVIISSSFSTLRNRIEALAGPPVLIVDSADYM